MHNPQSQEELEVSEREDLLNLERALLKNFKEAVYTSKEWVAEIVSLAVTKDKMLYQIVLSTYLSFLRDAPLLESYHLQGLAVLLHLSAQNDWLSTTQFDQIFNALQSKMVLTLRVIETNSMISFNFPI